MNAIQENYVNAFLLDKKYCEISYHYFFHQAWKVLEPETQLIDNWHIQYLCGIVQKETERIAAKKEKTKDYIINIIPRSLKSYICNIMWPAWAWTRFPWLKFINNSFVESLAIDLCVKSRRLIESQWYKERWGHVFRLTTDMNTKSHFDNNKRGMRRIASTGGNIYGTGADIIINDDPQDPQMAASETERETVKAHYRNLYTRLNNQTIGLKVNIQQRLDEDDLTAYLINNSPDEYFHICIPAELTDNVRPVELRKYYRDGLFFPSHPSFNRISLEKAKLPTNLGLIGYSAQVLQEPSPAQGSIFKKYHWRYWQPKNANLPPVMVRNEKKELEKAVLVAMPDKLDIVIDSWDTAFEGTETSDDVVGVKIGKHGANKYLLDRFKDKYTFKQTKDKIRELRYKNKATSASIIEKTANGPAIINELSSEIPGIIPIKTGRLSKEDRVKILDNTPYAAQVEAGNIYLPHPNIAPWVEDFIDEHAKFPKGKQDGQVDAFGQACNYLTSAKFIWPSYNSSNPDHYGDTSLMTFTEHHRYGAIFVNKNGYFNFLSLLWDVYNWRLYVRAEYSSNGMSAYELVHHIINSMNLKISPCQGLWCNAEAHDDFVKSASKIINTEFSNFNVDAYVNIPQNYDRIGSISLANIMFSRNQIFVDSKCNKASTQFSTWASESNNNAPSEDFELCECLCLGISQIDKQFRIVKPQDKLVDYKEKISVTGKKIDEEAKAESWQMR